jgi:transposase
MSSEERLKPAQIAERLRCSDQTVRRTLRAFAQEGMVCLEAKLRARLDEQRAFDDKARERLKELVRRSPREFGYDASLWTLETLAEVSLTEGLTRWLVSVQTMSQTLREAGINWQRAKHWITSPDEHYEAKKSGATG